MVAFDRSLLKLFTVRFSNKSVQAPSCKRPKTTRRNLFLSSEIKNFYQQVQRRMPMKKSRKLACQMVDSNIANKSLPTPQISVGIIALFENIYDGKPIFVVISNIGEDVHCTIPLSV